MRGGLTLPSSGAAPLPLPRPQAGSLSSCLLTSWHERVLRPTPPPLPSAEAHRGPRSQSTNQSVPPQLGSWLHALGFSLQSDKPELIEVTLMRREAGAPSPAVELLRAGVWQCGEVVATAGHWGGMAHVGNYFLGSVGAGDL